MASATIIAAWKDATNAYATARVVEGGARGNVEYGPVSTPLLDDQGNAKSATQLKADLTAALKAARDAQVAGPSALAMSGTVTV